MTAFYIIIIISIVIIIDGVYGLYFRKPKFRIVRMKLSEEGTKAFHPLWYRIEQRYTLLLFFHWWGSPSFEPPHLFENDCDAMKHIKKHYPNAIVYDYYSENKCKK